MRHPTDGTLRRLLDEPAGVADVDRKHIAACPTCQSGLAAAREDAAIAAAALNLEVTTDVEHGWRRLSGAAGAAKPRGLVAAVRGLRWRAARRSPVIAVIAVAALLAGGTAAAAGNWFQIFHTEQIAPVTAPEAELIKLPDLSAFGEVEVTARPNVRQVVDAGAAEEATGLSVPRVSKLPRGVTGEPVYRIGDQVSATFTFSVEKAARTVGAAGNTLPRPPEGLDGSQFRMTAGPGVAAVWLEAHGLPALVVARVVAPAVYSTGIPFATARDYLLALPGLPEDVASQLRKFSGDATTLPLFVSVERQTTSAADVGGHTATVLTSRGRVFAAVFWVRDGVVTAVAGSLSADEVLSVARGLRWDR